MVYPITIKWDNPLAFRGNENWNEKWEFWEPLVYTIPCQDSSWSNKVKAVEVVLPSDFQRVCLPVCVPVSVCLHRQCRPVWGDSFTVWGTETHPVSPIFSSSDPAMTNNVWLSICTGDFLHTVVCGHWLRTEKKKKTYNDSFIWETYISLTCTQSFIHKCKCFLFHSLPIAVSWWMRAARHWSPG